MPLVIHESNNTLLFFELLLLPLSFLSFMSCTSSQLGPNPSFLDGQKLSRGQSGKLTHGGVLFLVNQSHPFKLHYSLSSNGTASGATHIGLKAKDKTKGGKVKKESQQPNRSLKDYFSTSPMKVIYVLM